MGLTWEEVVTRADLVGGDFAFRECGVAYRGPIKAIRLEGGIFLVVELEWTATMNPETCGWEKCELGSGGFREKEITNTESYFVRGVSPENSGQWQIAFPISGTREWGVIYPKGGNKLDPATVKGLKV